jgi:purine-binding chemotaxis protein CheW
MNLKNIEEVAMSDNVEINSRQYVSFILAEELFGVEVTRTREILSLISVTKVPQTPDYLLGVINVRGQVVPVVDMRLKLGQPAGAETENTCIILIEIQVDDEAIVIGVLADAVREVLEISTDQIEPPPRLGTRLNTEFISGMGKINEQFIMLLNIDRIFNADDLSLAQEVSGDYADEIDTSVSMLEA